MNFTNSRFLAYWIREYARMITYAFAILLEERDSFQ